MTSPTAFYVAPRTNDVPRTARFDALAHELKRGRVALRRPWRWLGRSIGRRFVGMSLGLLLVVQLTCFMVIDASLQRHARKALPEQLSMAERALQRLLDWRSQRLVEGARLLAADYAFRAAVQTHDKETIASVLANHGARIGATEVALLDTDFRALALAEGAVWDSNRSPASLAQLAREALKPGGASEIALIDGKPRHVVLVPIKAPLVVAWVLMYFELPDAFSNELYSLTAVELTVLTREHGASAWQLDFSRLHPMLAKGLAALYWPAPVATSPHQANHEAEAAASSMTEVTVLGNRFGARTVRLTPFTHADATSARPEVRALLTLPLDGAMHAPADLQLALFITTALGFLAFGIGSVYSARRVTTPLQALALAAERLGAGDATTPIRHNGGRDEVRELANAFELMRMRLASDREKIVQSEKLASIGELAAGVAHEINNPIGFVFSNFNTLEEYLTSLFRMLAAYREEEAALAGTPSAARLANLRGEIELDYLKEDIPALMSESRDGLKRVRKIVQDLKDFSHVGSREEWEAVDLHVGLDSTLNIVNNEIKYKADVVKAYGTLPLVECLPHDLNQVFMNLLVNASHAIGAERGTIQLRTRVQGDDVVVEVQDNGIGIAAQNLGRIFDPFFTTKAVGKGTGLGLSLSYGIVKRHGGRIEVESELGVGTTFRVVLPAQRPVGV